MNKIEVEDVKIGSRVYTPIQVVKEWMGNAPGSKLTIIKNMADMLIQRGTAKRQEMEKTKGPKQTTKPVTKLIKKNEVVMTRTKKAPAAPPENKMVGAAGVIK